MEKIKGICVLSLLFVTLLSGKVCADLYVDSAPNYEGSPDWNIWWDQAKADVASGTFTDLRSVADISPGSYAVTPYEEIVYRTGDMGNRIQWIYWLPGESTASMEDRIEFKYVIDWNGANYTIDWSNNSWVVDSPDLGWNEPAMLWEDYDNGTGLTGAIGTFSFAFEADDNYAPSFSTDADNYNETDQADINALYSLVGMYQTFTTGYIRLRPTTDDEWVVTNILTVEVHTPVPAAVLLGAFGLGVAGLKLRKSS